MRNRKQTQLLRRRLISATVRDQAPSDRLVPSPLLTTAVVGWLLVAAVAAGAALSQTPRARMVPLDHLLTVELLSLGVWIGLTVPGLLLIRSMLRSRSAAARSLLSGLCVALACSVVFAMVEHVLLRLLVHPEQIRAATMILPDLDARILAFLGMVAVLRGKPLLAFRDEPARVATPSPSRRRLHPLTTQLQSHFLFNSLNDAAELVRIDPEAADDLLTRLSEFLRGALLHTEKQVASLSTELEFIQAYIEIQAIRVRHHLSVRWKIAPETLDAGVPTFFWQPVLENAFRYGATPETGKLTIEIGARQEDSDLVFWVRDAGPGFRDSDSNSPGIGLRNTRNRLARLYGARGTIEVPAQDRGALAVVRLPLSVLRRAPVTAQ